MFITLHVPTLKCYTFGLDPKFPASWVSLECGRVLFVFFSGLAFSTGVHMLTCTRPAIGMDKCNAPLRALWLEGTRAAPAKRHNLGVGFAQPCNSTPPAKGGQAFSDCAAGPPVSGTAVPLPTLPLEVGDQRWKGWIQKGCCGVAALPAPF